MTPPPSSELSINTAWILLGRFGQRALGIINTIVLARLLVPDDFGLVALATAIAAVIEVFGEFGFDLALIRDQQATRDHYNTAWTLNIVRGGVFAGVLLAVAEPIAWSFSEPRLGPVIMFLAIRPLIEGFYNIGIVDFRKHMMMHREFLFFVISKVASLLFVIPLAYLWRSYWALVAGIVSEQAVRLLLSYLLHQFRPRLCLREWRELFAFSKWVLSSEIVVAIGNRMDTFVVGKWGTPHDVGIYNVSYEVSNLPTTELVWPIARAVFPAYAKIASDTNAIAKAYLKSLAVILGIASPLACGIAVTADLLVPIMFGEKWLAAIPIIQILTVFGLIRVFLSTDAPLLIAMNRPNIPALFDLAGICVLIPLLFIGMAYFGLAGIAWVLVGTYSARIVANQIAIGLLLKLSLGARLSAIWRTVPANALMVLVVWSVNDNWPSPGDLIGLIVQLLAVSAIGAAVYAASLLALWHISSRPDGVESFVLLNLKRFFRLITSSLRLS